MPPRRPRAASICVFLRRQRARAGRTRRTFPPDTPAAAPPPPPLLPLPLGGVSGASSPLLAAAPLPAGALLDVRGALRPAVARCKAGRQAGRRADQGLVLVQQNGQSAEAGGGSGMLYLGACGVNCARATHIVLKKKALISDGKHVHSTSASRQSLRHETRWEEKNCCTW